MIGAVVIGVAGGVLAGMLGVGGGVLFVPGLVLFLSLHQVEAESTSLVAIVPVAVVGAWRQHGYGNVRLGDAVTLGLLSLVGAGAGVALSNVLPERALKVGFALLMVMVAAQLVRRAQSAPAEGAVGEAPAAEREVGGVRGAQSAGAEHRGAQSAGAEHRGAGSTGPKRPSAAPEGPPPWE